MFLCLFYCLDRCIITEYRVCLCWSDGLQRHNNTATVYSFRHPVRSADKGYIFRWSIIIKTDQNNITLHVCLAMPSMPNIYEYNMDLQSYLQCTNIRVVFLLWIQLYKSTFTCMFLCLPCKNNVLNKRFTSLLSLFTYNHACSNFCLCFFDS